MIYVIGDIHGCFDEFQDMLELIKFDPETDEMYFVGDYIDRGKDSCKMLDFIDQHYDDECFHFIRGNHEDEFASYVRLLYSIDSKKSLLELCDILHDKTQYFDMYGTIKNMLSDESIRDHVNTRLKRWASMFEQMPLHIIFRHNDTSYVITHAGYPLSLRGIDIEEFSLYSREEALSKGGRKHSTIISGHTPTVIPGTFAYNQGKVFEYYNEEIDCRFYDIDCGACLKNKYDNARLACMRLDDNKIFYV